MSQDGRLQFLSCANVKGDVFEERCQGDFEFGGLGPVGFEEAESAVMGLAVRVRLNVEEDLRVGDKRFKVIRHIELCRFKNYLLFRFQLPLLA